MKILKIIVILIVAVGMAAWFGLPPLFKALGFHPHYAGPRGHGSGETDDVRVVLTRIRERGDKT